MKANDKAGAHYSIYSKQYGGKQLFHYYRKDNLGI
jgi:hypothetical protein